MGNKQTTVGAPRLAVGDRVRVLISESRGKRTFALGTLVALHDTGPDGLITVHTFAEVRLDGEGERADHWHAGRVVRDEPYVAPEPKVDGIPLSRYGSALAERGEYAFGAGWLDETPSAAERNRVAKAAAVKALREEGERFEAEYDAQWERIAGRVAS